MMPTNSRVTMRPMTPDEYGRWRGRSVSSYAEDLVRATGRPLEQAHGRAVEQFAELLPSGQDTPGMWLMAIVDPSDEVVGWLWLGPHPERAGVGYVYDLQVEENARRRGFGRAAMVAAEQLVLDAGWSQITLNVFGFNEPAQRLYASLGYGVIATQMGKHLG